MMLLFQKMSYLKLRIKICKDASAALKSIRRHMMAEPYELAGDGFQYEEGIIGATAKDVRERLTTHEEETEFNLASTRTIDVRRGLAKIREVQAQI